MITSMTALAATTSGKIVLGSIAAATAFGGASAAGIVDMNADESTEVIIGADANADAAADNQFRVNARDAGSFGISVEGNELRLRDISSADGWDGRLMADTDTALLISFENETDVARQVTAELSLIGAADAQFDTDGDADIASYVLVKVTSEDGERSTIRFNTDGSVVVDGAFDLATELDAATTFDLDGTASTSTDADVDTAIDSGTTVAADTATSAAAELQVDAAAELGDNRNATLDAGTTVTAETTNGQADAAADLGVGTAAELDDNVNGTLDTGATAVAEIDENSVSTSADLTTDATVEVKETVTATVEAGASVAAETTNGQADAAADLAAETMIEVDQTVEADLDLGLGVDADLDDGLGADLDLDTGGGLGLGFN